MDTDLRAEIRDLVRSEMSRVHEPRQGSYTKLLEDAEHGVRDGLREGLTDVLEARVRHRSLDYFVVLKQAQEVAMMGYPRWEAEAFNLIATLFTRLVNKS